MEHDFSNDITVDSKGDIYLTGTFDNKITFGTTTLNNNLGDSYLAKINSLGNVIWAVKPTFNNAHGASHSVIAYKNRPIITGKFVDGGAPPIMVFGSDTLISNGSHDVFVTKVGPPCNYVTYVDLMAENDAEFKIFPNPFNNSINIQLPQFYNKKVYLKLLNSNGVTVYNQNFNFSENQIINPGDLPQGIYILQLISGNSSKSYKLSKR